MTFTYKHDLDKVKLSVKGHCFCPDHNGSLWYSGGWKYRDRTWRQTADCRWYTSLSRHCDADKSSWSVEGPQGLNAVRCPATSSRRPYCCWATAETATAKSRRRASRGPRWSLATSAPPSHQRPSPRRRRRRRGGRGCRRWSAASCVARPRRPAAAAAAAVAARQRPRDAGRRTSRRETPRWRTSPDIRCRCSSALSLSEARVGWNVWSRTQTPANTIILTCRGRFLIIFGRHITEKVGNQKVLPEPFGPIGRHLSPFL